MSERIRRPLGLNIEYNPVAFEAGRQYTVAAHQLLVQGVHPTPLFAATEIVRLNEAAIYPRDLTKDPSPIIDSLAGQRQAILEMLPVQGVSEVDQPALAGQVDRLMNMSYAAVTTLEGVDAELAAEIGAEFGAVPQNPAE